METAGGQPVEERPVHSDIPLQTSANNRGAFNFAHGKSPAVRLPQNIRRAAPARSTNSKFIKNAEIQLHTQQSIQRLGLFAGYPFGIRIGRMRILGPTAVTIIFVIGGLALLAFTVREIMQARKLIAQGGEITVEGGKVTIPVVRKKEVVNESFLLSEVEYTKFDEEENEFKISLPADHHVIRGAFFENAEAFDAFKSIFDK